MTNLAIAHARLRNSRLIGEPLASTADVVGWFGAVQSQDTLGALWAVAQRMAPGATMADVGGSLDSAEIVRTHAMRPTWHFLAPGDLRWIQRLTGGRVHQATGTMYRRLGLGDAAFALAEDVFRDELAGGRWRTRDELAAVLADRGLDVSNSLVTTHLAMHAELELVICNGPRRERQQTYGLVDERVLPEVGAPPSRHEALRELVIRYFRSHGPALVRDMSWWSGLTVGDVRRGIALAGDRLETRTLDGKEYWSATGAFDPTPDVIPDPFVRLVSNYDEYLGSYTDYSPVFDPALPKARNVGDVLGAHIVVRDGLVVGGWRRAIGPKLATVTVTLLVPLTPADIEALELETAAFGRFLGLPAELRVAQG